MQLTILGSSGGCPGPANPASGYLIQEGDTAIWCDAGSGTFMPLMELIDPGRLDAVVISHVHTDHCADLIALFGYLAYGPSGTVPKPVYLPPKTVEPMAAFVRADSSHVFHTMFDFRVVRGGDTATIGPLELRFADTAHPVPTIATRFEAGGRSLAYSADTGPGGGFLDLARGADTVLCEASLAGTRTEHTYPYHLTGGEAGMLAAEAGAGRLIVTHVSPTLDAGAVVSEARAAFGGRVLAATPGLSVTI
jgi:ribonuclease BN (tRNA processing enzyme)